MVSVGDCTDLFGDEGLNDKGYSFNFGLLLVANVYGDKA